MGNAINLSFTLWRLNCDPTERSQTQISVRTGNFPEGDASAKWEANSEVMTYLRQNLNAVADLIVAAVNVSSRPGGINHTRLHEAVAALPKIGGKK